MNAANTNTVLLEVQNAANTNAVLLEVQNDQRTLIRCSWRYRMIREHQYVGPGGTECCEHQYGPPGGTE